MKMVGASENMKDGHLGVGAGAGAGGQPAAKPAVSLQTTAAADCFGW